MIGGGGGADDPNVHLNLVPLIDILTNILFFLLIGFAAEEMKYEGDLKLPAAAVDANLAESPKITISRTQLLVGDVSVAKVVNGKIAAEVEGQKIVPLYERLNTLRAEIQDKSGGVAKDSDVVLLYADRTTPFTELMPVLKTAAMAGFPNFRFAVVKR